MKGRFLQATRWVPMALLGAGLTACGPGAREGEVRPFEREGRAGIVLVEGEERFTDGEWVKHGFFTFRNEYGEVTSAGSYRNGLEDGIWDEVYDDGSTGRGPFRGGVRSGAWETRHPNGRIQDAGRYESGQRTGVWVSYRLDGTKLREAEYASGQENGRVHYYEADGKTVDEVRSGEYEDGERVRGL